MPIKKYSWTWDQIAALDADYMASWGAFEDTADHTIDFDDDTLPTLAFRMDRQRDEFIAAYRWQHQHHTDGKPTGDFIRSRVAIERRPCRFGGSRVFFICPACARRTSRLAVLQAGFACGTCGRVTWGSRRERPIQRLIRRANKLSVRLECDSWRDAVSRRPLHMRFATFARLTAERNALVAEINRRLAVRLARSGSLMGALSTMCKLGL